MDAHAPPACSLRGPGQVSLRAHSYRLPGSARQRQPGRARTSEWLAESQSTPRATATAAAIRRRSADALARRTSARPALSQRREPRQQRIARTKRLARTPQARAEHADKPLSNLVQHPAGAMEDRRQNQTHAHRRGNRPPAPKPKNAGQTRGMTGREKTLQKLLRHIDTDQADRTNSPQRRQRKRVTRHRSLTRQRAPQRPQETADRETHRQHDPRHHRVQIRVPLARQLDTSVPAKGQHVAQLMHSKRGHRHQCRPRQASNHRPAISAREHPPDTIPLNGGFTTTRSFSVQQGRRFAEIVALSRARPQTPRATERGTSSPSAAGHPRALKVPKRLPKLTTSRSAEEHQRELRSPKHGASNSEDTCTALQSRLRRFDSRRRLFCLQISGYCGSNCLCRCRQRRRPSAPKPEVVHPAMIPSGPGFRARGRSLVDWDETRVEVRAVPRVLELERSQRESANRVGLLEYRCGYAQPARLCSRGPTRRRGSGDPNVALACLSSRSH